MIVKSSLNEQYLADVLPVAKYLQYVTRKYDKDVINIRITQDMLYLFGTGIDHFENDSEVA